MSDKKFFDRVGLSGGIDELFVDVLNDYQLGNYKSHELIPIGYEDCNLRLTTTKGDYFVKILKLSRNDNDCQRYADIMRAETGINATVTGQNRLPEPCRESSVSTCSNF